MSNQQLSVSILEKAGQDVRLLLSHIARQGKSLEPDDNKTILEAVDNIQKKNITAEQEGKFWKIYSELLKLAHPARIDSLYYNDYLSSIGGGPATADDPILVGLRKHERTLKLIRALSLSAFAITLALLAYLSITEDLMKRNLELSNEYQLLLVGVWEGTSIDPLVKATQKNPVDSDAGGNQEQPGTGRGKSVSGPADKLIVARQGEIIQLVSANDRLLAWLRLSKLATPGKVTDSQSAPYDMSGLSSQRNINALLSGYILPTFSAFLGVTVYLMRNASGRIRELSFRSNDASVYWHRVVLGVIGGLAISWFAISDTTGVLRSIAPAALAFLVGYSVEVLYNVLDSLVKALGAPNDSA